MRVYTARGLVRTRRLSVGMAIARWTLGILLFGISVPRLSAQRSPAQLTTSNATISEPGVYQLAELYKFADIVALVKIVSGDTENYEEAVYKAKVAKSFKGVPEGETIYFGPYVGERLGWEYIVFLHKAKGSILPKTGSDKSYGNVP